MKNAAEVMLPVQPVELALVPMPREADPILPEMMFETPPLSMADAPWLESMAGHKIDRAWLREANNAAAAGSVNLRKVAYTGNGQHEGICDARHTFFGELLGWQNENHELHGVYQTVRAEKPNLVMPQTFIATQRALACFDVDPVRFLRARPSNIELKVSPAWDKLLYLEKRGLKPTSLLKKYPAVLSLPLERIKDGMDHLEEQGLDPVKVTASAPQILQFSEAIIKSRVDQLVDLIGVGAFEAVNKFAWLLVGDVEHIERKIHLLQSFTNVLGWKHDVWELIDAKPVILGLRPEKLITHARLFARFGNKEMSPSQVANLLVEPLDNHILAAANHDLLNGYTARNVRLAGKDYSAKERRDKTLHLIESGEAVRCVGAKVVDAYQRYIAA